MSLKYLKEISSVVTNYTKKAPFEGVEKGSKTEILVEGILNGIWENEDDAKSDIYGKQLTGRSFDMLKSRAKEHLVNTIFVLDTKKRFKSSYDQAYYTTGKNLVAGLILINRNSPNMGQELLKLSLRDALKYQFHDFALNCLRLLRYSTTYVGNQKKYEYYNELIKKCTDIIKVELRCEELNQTLIFKYVMSAASKSTTAPIAKQFYEECKKLNNQFDTYSTRINMYRVGIRYYDSIHDYNAVIQLASECEKYLKKNPHLIQKVRLGEMSLHKLYSALHLKDYDNGKVYSAQCQQLYNPGTINWLIFTEYFFLLCLHTGRLSEAATAFQSVIHDKNYQKYPTSNKEKWKIFEAFLHYALPETRENKKRFNTARFINEVPIFSKDKAGYNLSIIIAQIILLIKAGEFEKVVEKAEALKLYASRYIKKEKSPRSYYFIKMLLVMIKYDFEPTKTEEIAEKFFVKLKATHMGEQNQLETLEVIPYDLLWPRLLEQLRKK